MARVVVYHSYYGCETGCCGHTVELDGQEKFLFDHPGRNEDPLTYAKELVEATFGAEHVADLDWAGCIISDD